MKNKNYIETISNLLCSALSKLLENILSKKFLVFITATVLLSTGFLTPELWITIALAILGVVSALDFKNKKSSKLPRIE